MFKVGLLLCKGGMLQWKQLKDGEKPVDGASTYTGSKAMVHSVQQRDLSMKTPSVAKTSRSRSQATSHNQSFHMANPNPQATDQKYRGVREAGYVAVEQALDPQDFVRFGKKVNYENKLTNDQILEAHLQQMRQNAESNRLKKEIKRKQDQDFLEHIKHLEQLEQVRIKNGLEAMRKDQNEANQKILDENKVQKELQQRAKQKEELQPFPFVSGELIEKHRASLGA